MFTSRSFVPVFGVAALLCLVACGGLGDPGTSYAVLPKTANASPGQNVKLTVIVANADVVSFDYSVEGGDANGTVTPVFNDHARAIYTAPQTPGTYVVHASFTQFGGQVYSGTSTITVQ